jgi:Ca-activated chloride channel family protein
MNRPGPHRGNRAVVAALLVVVWAAPGPARARGQEGGDPDVRLASDLVLVPVAVRHESGGPVTDLRISELTLTEDGASQEIAVFERDTGPVDVALLLDSSASIDVSLETIQRAAYAFAKQLRPEDRISVIAFADRPVILLDWTTDLKAVNSALRAIEPKGGTALYGSVVAVIDERFRYGPPGRRRAMIVLTDGVDTLSSVTSRTAARAALRRDVSVYVVSMGRILDEILQAIVSNSAISAAKRYERRIMRDQVRRAEEPLNYLAVTTGARAVFPRGLGDLSKAYAEIAGEIRSRYLLGYYPARPGVAGFRAIAVSCKRPRVSVHARGGYYRREEEGGRREEVRSRDLVRRASRKDRPFSFLPPPSFLLPPPSSLPPPSLL